MSTEKLEIKRTHRRVIERKLLEALSDAGTVAILASEQDLEDIIAALQGVELVEWDGPEIGPSNAISWHRHRERKRNLSEGLIQLRDAAFPRKQQ